MEEIERRNNIKNKKEKKRRSKSKDRGLPKLEGKKTVKNIVNTILRKDHKSNLFGVKDHHDKKDEGMRTRERRLSVPGVNTTLLHSSSRSVMGEPRTEGRPSRYDTLGSRRQIGHPSAQSELNFSMGNRGRVAGPHYRIYLKDADPLLSDYYINMTNFEQCCEPTGAKYAVRREFYPHTSPAGKGSKWEWSGETRGDWHIYDMEVQVVIEDSWAKGEQTVDISHYFPGCPYIMNFCNLTQVRKTTGFVRPMRRMQQAAYPMVKLTQAEIAAMIGRREDRRKMAMEEIERRNNIKN